MYGGLPLHSGNLEIKYKSRMGDIWRKKYCKLETFDGQEDEPNYIFTVYERECATLKDEEEVEQSGSFQQQLKECQYIDVPSRPGKRLYRFNIDGKDDDGNKVTIELNAFSSDGKHFWNRAFNQNMAWINGLWTDKEARGFKLQEEEEEEGYQRFDRQHHLRQRKKSQSRTYV